MASSTRGTKYPGVKNTDKGKPWLTKRFEKGNTLAKQRKSALKRAKNEIPAEYHVTCLATDGPEELMKYADILAVFALTMDEMIGRVDHVEDIRHVAAYTKLRTALQNFRLRDVRAPTLAKLTPEQVTAAKQEYASNLSLALTRLAFTNAQEKWRKSGTLYSWAGRDTAEMLGATLTTIKSWAELLVWEESKTIDSKAQAVEAYAREVSAGAESG